MSLRAITESFFFYGQVPETAIRGEYSLGLVALSFIIAVLGSFSALRLATNVRNAPTTKLQNIIHIAGALTFGTGIWSMHFIGMMAFKTDMVHTYDPVPTFLSMIFAVIVAYGVIRVIRIGKFTALNLAAGSVLLGGAICLMHYTGMYAMQMDADLKYIPSLFFTSVGIAITASCAALVIVLKLGKYEGSWKLIMQIAAALMMGAAICGMHYTGMAASVIVPYADCRFDSNQDFSSLVLLITLASSAIFAITITLSFQGSNLLSVFEKGLLYSGKAIFFQLSLLLSLFLLLFVASYTLINSSLYQQNDKQKMELAAYIQFSLINNYYAYSSAVIYEISKNKSLKDKNPEIAEEIKDLSLDKNMIEQNFKSLMQGGDISLHNDFNEKVIGFKIIDARNKGLNDRLKTAFEEWKKLDEMIREALENATDTPQSSVISHKKIEPQLLKSLEEQQKIIVYLQAHLEEATKSIEERHQIILIISLLLFCLTMAYASHFIVGPIDQANEKLKIYHTNLERDVKEKTADLEKLRIEEKRKATFLDTLLNHMPLGIFVKDVKNDYRMALVNKHAEKLFSVKYEDMLGTTDYDHWPKEQADFFRQTDESVMHKGKVVDIEAEPVTTPKGTFIAHTIKVPIYDDEGQPYLLLGMIEDATQRIEAQKELKKAKERAESLNTKMWEYMDKLEQEGWKAQEANRAKSNFLANMSHEIRTPMNVVMGISRLLMDTKLSEEQKEYARAISSSGETLLNIINDIIDFSKIEAGKLKLEHIDFDFYELLQDVTSLFAYQAREKRIEMIITTDRDYPRQFLGDPVRIKQIFANLLSNALKFTSQGHVLIDIRQEDSDSNHIEIKCRVEDTGIGIPQDKQNQIFEKFTQAEESTTRRFGGTGLGLTIVSELVKLMGGNIRVESEMNKGSAFIFSLTLEKSARKEEVQIDKNLTGTKVLIVDDYQLTRDMMNTSLTRKGLICDCAESGEEALKLLESGKKYDVCIVDYFLQGMDGINLVEKIRELNDHREMILFMVSGAMDHKPYEELKKLGLKGYLKKPFRRDQLFTAINQALDDRKQNRGDAPFITRHNTTGVLRANNESSSASYKQFPKCTVLAVEDMKMNMMLIKKVLSKYGVKIHTAENGREALEKMQKGDFDIVFMDCQMPVMDGFEATQKIRKLEKNDNRKTVPIIALTADAMVGDREKCLAAGMSDYINKPFKEEEIGAMLDKWVRQSAHI